MDLEEERGRGSGFASPVWLSRADDSDRVDVGGEQEGKEDPTVAPGASEARAGAGRRERAVPIAQAAGDYCVRCSCSCSVGRR